MSSDDALAESGSKGDVVTLCYTSEPRNDRGGVFEDLAAAMAEATEAGQPARVRRARDLVFDYFGDQLPSLGVQGLLNLLESRRTWRRYNEWPVYKTTGTPCLAFTASVDEAVMRVNLIAVGLCNRYPSNDEELWWQSTIRPRIEDMLL
jgi:hypothetical protein